MRQYAMMVLFCLLVPISCPCLMFMLALINCVSLFLSHVNFTYLLAGIYHLFMFYRTPTKTITCVGTQYSFPLPAIQVWILGLRLFWHTCRLCAILVWKKVWSICLESSLGFSLSRKSLFWTSPCLILWGAFYQFAFLAVLVSLLFTLSIRQSVGGYYHWVVVSN